MAKQITLRMLREREACDKQVELFRSLFGDAAQVTEDAAVAVADRFNWDWAASNFLTAPALAEYDRVGAAARAEYVRVRAPALAEYDRVTEAAVAEYVRVTAPARAEYDRVTEAAWTEYERMKARTFARLYRGQEG